MQIQPEGSSSRPRHSEQNIDLEIIKLFAIVDADKSGKIKSSELQAALVNAQGKKFSDETCRLMISLFDTDKSGSIDIGAFQQLYIYINQWMDVFRTYDKDQSGYIDEHEFLQALNQMGYGVTLDFVRVLFKNNLDKRMTFDEFVLNCVKIQRLTNGFRSKDIDLKGVINISFDNFVELILNEFLV